MSPGPRASCLFGPLLVLAVAAGFLFVFSRTPMGQVFVDWTTAQLEVEQLEGRIVDATTGAGIAGATVVLRSLDAMWTPSLTGSLSHGADTTDAEGRFTIRYQQHDRTKVSARADGFATILEVPIEGEEVVLPTAPCPPGVAVDHAEFHFDLTDSTARASLRLSDLTPDSASADLAFAYDGTQVVLAALGDAALVVDTPPPATNPIDPLAARCLAPDSGYVARHAVPVERTTVTTWFVRLREGKGWARVRIRCYWRGPTAREGYRLDGERWLDPTGGRSVCEQPREGEHYEFARTESPD